MLTLKLLLVPAFVLLVSLAGTRWGPSVAGWLAGLPVVAGPILFFLAVERGIAFASDAAAAALSAVFAAVIFSAAYSHGAQRMSWLGSLLSALLAWAVAVFALSWLPTNASLSLAVSLLALVGAPRCFPATPVAPSAHIVGTAELCCRMAAGAALTLAVTLAANRLGAGWSGLMAVFPVLGSVLAVFSHRAHGAAFVAALLRAMATGLYSFAAFCYTLSLALPHVGVAAAFALATAVAVSVQTATKRHLAPASSVVPSAIKR